MLGWRRWFRKPLIWATVPALAALAFVVASVILFGPAQIAKGRSLRNDRGAQMSHTESDPVPPGASSAPESATADRAQTETAAAATLSTSDTANSPQAAATTSRQRISQ
jgi:hypothetical protein